jgi:hypothetical protein
MAKNSGLLVIRTWHSWRMKDAAGRFSTAKVKGGRQLLLK